MDPFENYTPHTIIVELPDGRQLEFKSLGIARVTEEQSIRETIEGIEVRETRYKEIIGLPDCVKDRKCIISMVVAQANLRTMKPRTDLVCPDTGRSCLRDEKGQIRAVTGFVVY
jgi:hypothetical protein